ncbi:unnamed protein product [Schistocephalus solidus]|uniref:Activin_recp domain-containing protein n=1 Tax=Schistocephalus solidus TaxID=70667 RepID=A0A183T4T7_SCHSO|nr:unnamed protein product [Schistocephalus solidus]
MDGNDMWTQFRCISGHNTRCCKGNFCNMPTDKEVDAVTRETPQRLHMIVVGAILALVLLLLLIGILLFSRYKRESGFGVKYTTGLSAFPRASHKDLSAFVNLCPTTTS